MGSRLTIKRGDKHTVQLTITNPPTNLDGGSVQIFVTPSVGGEATPFSGSITGNVVSWTLDGTLSVGRYRLEVQVSVGAYIVTAPNDGYMELIVMQDLDD